VLPGRHKRGLTRAPCCAQGQIVRLAGLGQAGDLFSAPDRKVLASTGADLDAVRARIKAAFGPDAFTRRFGDHRLTGPGDRPCFYDPDSAETLVVRVSTHAAGGNATKAALSALAAASGPPRSVVTPVAGAPGRSKIAEVTGAAPTVVSRLLARPG
jgi:uncharacterized protein YggU (UPF0235/DUF167 family)